MFGLKTLPKLQENHVEWDIQLSSTDKQKIGWTTRRGNYANIYLGG
ncbi:polymorphic toxin type 17 domain-containing protein [Klebsiella aerogenes]